MKKIILYVKVIVMIPYFITSIILDIILGKKYTYQDNFFKKVESESIRNKKNETLSWYPEYRLFNSKEDTFICIDGNIEKPNTEQLKDIKYIINDYRNLLKRLNSEIEKYFYANRNLKAKWNIDDLKDNYWMDSMIHSDGLYEISFIPIDEDSELPLISFDLDLTSDKILNFEF